MGQELLIASLAIKKSKTPNWDKARAAIEWNEDTVGGYEEAHGEEPEDEDALIDWLGDLVDNAEEAWKSQWRNSYVTDYIVPGWRVWIAGGDSWGDVPCEEYDVINNLLNTGLAEKAGFAVRGF